MTSVDDGSLSRERPSEVAKVAYSYPNPGWMMGVVGFGPSNLPDPARRVLTFTTEPHPQAVDEDLHWPLQRTCRKL